MKPRILYVDDDPAIVEAYTVRLEGEFEMHTALSGEQALERVRAGESFEVVLADMRMPGMDGVEMLAEIRRHDPDATRMMLTGNADLSTAIEAVNRGRIFRFLTKPCKTGELIGSLNEGVRMHRLARIEREMMDQTLKGSIKVLMDVLALVSPANFSRCNRLKRYVRWAADKLDCREVWRFELAAMLSQLGCVSIVPDTVDKAFAGQELSPEEAASFAAHPRVACDLLGNIPRLESITGMIARQMVPFDQAAAQDARRLDEQVLMGGNLLHAALAFDRLIIEGLDAPSAADRLLADQGEYDPAICRALASAEVGFDGLVLRAVSADALCPRMVLAQDVRAVDGRLLVTRGQEVTLAVVARLRNWSAGIGVREPIQVYVPAPSSARRASA